MKRFSIFAVVFLSILCVSQFFGQTLEDRQSWIAELESPSVEARLEGIRMIRYYKISEALPILEQNIWAQEPQLQYEYWVTIAYLPSTNLHAITLAFIASTQSFPTSLNPLLMRVEATEILFSMGDYSTAQYIFEYINREKPNIPVSSQLLYSVVRHVPQYADGAMAELFRIADVSSFGSDRLRALNYLTEFRGGEMIPRLLDASSNDPDADVRYQALSRLVGLEYPMINQLFKQRIPLEPSWSLRLDLIEYLLVYYGTPADYQFVANYYPHETDANVSSWILIFFQDFYPLVPPPTVPLNAMIDNLLSLDHQVATYGWISDQSFVDELEGYLNNAKNYLVANDATNCARQLQIFQQRVDEEYQTAGHDDMSATVEGWKFLHYNAEYVLDRLPKATITIESNPSGRTFAVDGINYTAPQNLELVSGTVHTIAAGGPQGGGEACAAYTFDSWSDNGAQSHEITVTGPATYMENFSWKDLLTIGTTPPGLLYKLDDQPYSTGQELYFPPGSIHKLGAYDQPGGPGFQYKFQSWNDGGYPTHNIALSSNCFMYRATFIPQYQFTTTVDQGVGGSTSPSGQFWADSGGNVSVTATPTTGYTFSQWLGDVTGTNSTVTVAANSAKIFSAKFKRVFQVTVQPNPAGRTFTVDGVSYTTAQVFTWDSASTHTIETTTPQVVTGGDFENQYRWVSWSDGGAISHTVSPSSAVTYTVNFQQQAKVYFSTNPPGRTYTIDGVSYTGANSVWRDVGVLIALSTTSPQSGTSGTRYVYLSWSDNGNQSHNITAALGATRTLNFTTQYQLTVSSSPSGTGSTTPTGGSFYNNGSNVSITATPNPGYLFSSWSGDATGSTNPVTVTMNAVKNVTANFVAGPPTISSFTPTAGTVGASVTITGTNYSGSTSVKFNGTTASFTVNSSTQITATVPGGATSGTISVTNSGGTATSVGSFTVAPTVTSFAPTSGVAGTSVTISGTDFTSVTSSSGVKLNGTIASYTVNSSTQITATVPSGATTGTISVTNSGGTGTSSTNFTVSNLPTVSSFSPGSAPVGASVTVTGTYFTGATSVKFNGTTVSSFTVNSATQISTTVPSGATTGSISVTTPYGTASSASSFTIVLPATISSFTPSTGGTGTIVTISGTNFLWTTSVKFNGTSASGFTVNSATQISATAPSGVTTGPLSVTNVANTATSSTNFTVSSTKYTLTIVIHGSGTVTKSPNFSSYSPGINVELIATPNGYWTFDHWAGDVPAGLEYDSPLDITMDGNKTIHVYFTP